MIEDSGTWFCENSTKIAQNCANDREKINGRERDENCEKEKNMRMCAMIIKDDVLYHDFKWFFINNKPREKLLIYFCRS